MGKKYIKPDYHYTVNNVDEVTYSMANGDEFEFNINELQNGIHLTFR